MMRLAMLLLIAVCLHAQNPPGMFPWWETPIVKDLDLTEEQSARIRTAVREHRGVIIDVRAAMEKAELDVEDGFNADPVDQRRVAEAMERLIKARGDMLREFSKVALRLRLVLTPAQWKELQRRMPANQPQRQPGPRPPNRPNLRGGPQGPPQGPPQQPPR